MRGTSIRRDSAAPARSGRWTARFQLVHHAASLLVSYLPPTGLTRWQSGASDGEWDRCARCVPAALTGDSG
jgi:hypothetical protein